MHHVLPSAPKDNRYPFAGATAIVVALFVLPFAAQAHAAEDSKLVACEQALATGSRSVEIAKGVNIMLGPSDALLRGSLRHARSPEKPDQTYWLIEDHFLARELTPLAIGSTQQLGHADRLFILDEKGQVAISGFFTENHFRPMLSHDTRGERPLIEGDKLRRHFYERSPAVAVITMNPLERQLLRLAMKIWKPRYLKHRDSGRTTVTVGTTPIRRAHFEQLHEGRLASTLVPARPLHPDELQTYGGRPLYGLLLEFYRDDGVRIPVQDGDRLYVLDDRGEPGEELIVGTRAAPLYGGAEELEPLVGKFKEGPRAVLLQTPVKRPGE